MEHVLNILLIFVVRVISSMIVSFRTIYSLQGRKLISSFFGFFEASLFALIVIKIIGQVDDPVILIVYGLGYGAGCMFAVMLEQKIGLGNLAATVILQGIDNDELIKTIREEGLGVTVLNGGGRKGPRDVLIVSLHRKDLINFKKIISDRAEDAFVSVAPVNALGGYIKRLRTH